MWTGGFPKIFPWLGRRGSGPSVLPGSWPVWFSGFTSYPVSALVVGSGRCHVKGMTSESLGIFTTRGSLSPPPCLGPGSKSGLGIDFFKGSMSFDNNFLITMKCTG